MSLPPPLPPRSSSRKMESPELGNRLAPPSQSSPLPPQSSSSSLSSSPSSSPSLSAAGLLTPDFRSVSQVSLCPDYADIPPQKRELLLIYIHGFMGNETSFQSFPAHLHNVLSTHVHPDYFVHTKVYPKFETRHAISLATFQFSRWLSRFEGPMTDVVLLGHSMGGILAAEVVRLTREGGDGRERRHRILGVVAFDTPFLGMHPGVITAGLGSLFRPKQETRRLPEQEERKIAEAVFGPPPKRNFTVSRPKMKKEKKWDSALHFITKHHDKLTQATTNYLMSHLEFGSCLIDPVGLKERYGAIRSLEDGVWNDETQTFDRVRFVNYYTVSFGREKKHNGSNDTGGGSSVSPAPPPPSEVVGHVVTEDGDGGHHYIPDSYLAASVMTGSTGTSSTIAPSVFSDTDSIDGRPESSRSSFLTENMRAALSQTSLTPGKQETTVEEMEPSQLPQIPHLQREGGEEIPASPPSSPSQVLTPMVHIEPMPQPYSPPPSEPEFGPDAQHEDVVVDPRAAKEAEKQRKADERKVEKQRKADERDAEKQRKAEEKEVEKQRKADEKVVEKQRKAVEKEAKKEHERLEKIRKKAEKAERAERESIISTTTTTDASESTIPIHEPETSEILEPTPPPSQPQPSSLSIPEPPSAAPHTNEEESITSRPPSPPSTHLPNPDLPPSSPSPPPASPPSPPSSAPPPPPPLTTLPPPPSPPPSAPPAPSFHSPPPPPPKKKRERRFCILPSAASNDPTWHRVEMQGVDEVGAHCGLFFIGEVYAGLVGEVARKVSTWVEEEMVKKEVENAWRGCDNGEGSG